MYKNKIWKFSDFLLIKMNVIYLILYYFCTLRLCLLEFLKLTRVYCVAFKLWTTKKSNA